MRHATQYLAAGLLSFSTLYAGGQQQSASTTQIAPMALGDTNADLVFTPLSPCRIIDTRLTGLPLPTGGFLRHFKVAGTLAFPAQGGTAGGCGVPNGSTSVLINFVAVNPQGAGNLRGTAYDTPLPPTGSILNYQLLSPNLNIANGLIFQICDPATHDCSFDISITANGAATHLVADVMGYFRAFPREETITSITPGAGLAGGGSSGEVTLSADFTPSGTTNGSATTVARGDHKHYQKTIIVSPIGTPTENGIALRDAVDGIIDYSETNPYLVKVEPGTYDFGTATLFLKPYVDIEGSGEAITILTGSGPTNSFLATLYGAANSEVRFLTVTSTGTLSYATAITANSGRFRHVTARASGADVTIALLVQGGSNSADLADMTLSASGRFNTYGLYVTSDAVVSIQNSTIAATLGTGEGDGVFLGGTLRARNVSIDVDGRTGTFQSGIALVYGFLTLAGSTVSVSAGNGPAAGRGIYSGGGATTISDSSVVVTTTGALGFGIVTQSTSSPLVIQNSRIAAPTATISQVGGSIRVRNSGLDGGPVSISGPAGSVVCAGVSDEAFVFYPNTCP